VQNFDPVKQLDVHLCGFAYYKDFPNRQVRLDFSASSTTRWDADTWLESRSSCIIFATRSMMISSNVLFMMVCVAKMREISCERNLTKLLSLLDFQEIRRNQE
jgi:hypothetical protein